jgi:UDP-N-acetylmuramoyl-tripeptide--D-alanyl-D-alanine ligase
LKKPALTLQDLFDIPAAEIFNPDSLGKISAVSADSRKIPSEALFIAIKGEKFDGHDFIQDAVNNGAAAVMIEKRKSELLDKIEIPVVVVEDTVKALGYLASIWRKKLTAKVIAITGSAGKTTTKEMLSAVLSSKYKVNKTVANNNNHIGVPFTILSTNNSHEILVAELGTNHFGEIKYTAEIAAPDYALITNIGYSHLEFLKDKKGVMKEKGVLLDVTSELGGMVFINNDDPLIQKYSGRFSNKTSYGFEAASDVTGKIIRFDEEGNPEVEIRYGSKHFKVIVPSPGEQSAYNFLAVCTAAFALGLNKNEIISGIGKFKNIAKRLTVKKTEDFILLDDSYNANPDSMRYSISLLSTFKDRNKVAILGDMFELGEDAAEHHWKLSKILIKHKVDEVYTIGVLMKNLFNEINMKKIKSRHFVDRQTLKNFLTEHDFRNSVILVKGSRGMKMEEFVEVLEEKA